MQRVMDYMKMNSIRTTELVRSFDKRASNNINTQEFVRRGHGKITYKGGHIVVLAGTLIELALSNLLLDITFI